MQTSGKLPDRTNNDSSLAWSLKELQTHPAPSSACQPADFYCHCGLLVFKATMYPGRRGYRVSENIIKLSLIEILLFFLNKYSPDSCKPLVNFQRSEQSWLIFLPVWLALLRRWFLEILIPHSCWYHHQWVLKEKTIFHFKWWIQCYEIIGYRVQLKLPAFCFIWINLIDYLVNEQIFV